MKKKKVPQLGVLNNRNVLSHSLGGQMSKIKVLARWVPCECCERNLLQASPLASGGFLPIFDILLLIEASLQSLPSSSHGVLPVCLSVSKFPLFIRTPVLLD